MKTKLFLLLFIIIGIYAGRAVSDTHIYGDYAEEAGTAGTVDGSTIAKGVLNALLSNAAGSEEALTLNYTTNKAAGNDTGLLINMTDTSSPGTSLPFDIRVGGTSKASITSTGYITGTGLTLYSPWLIRTALPQSALILQQVTDSSSTSGSYTKVEIRPTYNQPSGSASNTDLKIN